MDSRNKALMITIVGVTLCITIGTGFGNYLNSQVKIEQARHGCIKENAK